jgi:hypothetical protein
MLHQNAAGNKELDYHDTVPFQIGSGDLNKGYILEDRVICFDSQVASARLFLKVSSSEVDGDDRMPLLNLGQQM